MKLELSRFINDTRVKSGQYNKLQDAFDGMKLWVSMDSGLFDNKALARYGKHFKEKNLDEDHVIFPNEHQTESNDYFLLKRLDAAPRTAGKRPHQEPSESEDREGDLHPIRWEKQHEDFVGPYACIVSMSQSVFKKYTDSRAKLLCEYTAFAKEVSDRKGTGDLSCFVQITAQINRLEDEYRLHVRYFLMYMCQSGLPPVESLYDVNHLCMHTPANKLKVQLRIFEVAITETFNLPDFNSLDLCVVGDLLAKSFDIQDQIDGSAYVNEDLMASFSMMNPDWFLDPSFLRCVPGFMRFGEDLLWKAGPTDQDFNSTKLAFLEKLSIGTGQEFLAKLDDLGYSSDQIQFYAFGGEESPNDEGSYNLLIHFFSEKFEVDHVRRVKDLKMVRFPELRAFLPEIPLAAPAASFAAV